MPGPLHNIQASFAGGEFNPALYARVDLAKYLTGLRRGRNVNVMPTGGVRNRAGTMMVAAAGDSTHAVRVVGFVYSNAKAYILEFGHQYIRFFTLDGQILSGGNPYQISSPYAGTDLFDLKFTQSGNTLYITHNSYAPRSLTLTSDTSWTLSQITFLYGPFQLQNTDTTKTLKANIDGFGNPIIIATGFTPFVAGHVGSLWDIEFPVQGQNDSETFTGTGASGIPIKCGRTWRIITNGTWTGVVHVQERHTEGPGSGQWNTIRTLQAKGDINYDTSGDTGQDQCVIRVVSDVISGVAWSGTAYVQLSSDSFFWHLIAKVTVVNSTTQVHVSYQKDHPWGVGLYLLDQYTWSEGSWSTYRGFPATSAFFQDRQCFGATPTEPQTVWASQTGIYNNFGVSSPLEDTDTISVLLPSRTVNIVRNLMPLSALIAMTSDAEGSIGPGSSGAFTPTSTEVQIGGHRGAASVTPVVVGNEIIFVQQMGTVVRNLIFQLAVQGYMGDNISIISQHLFTGYTIAEMAYQQEPDSIVWMVRSDGKLLSLTYLREQEVQAWTWHDSVGTFESVAVIPSPANGFNEPWFVYNLNGIRYIVRMLPRDGSTAPEDQFFVDCGLTFLGPLANVITGKRVAATTISGLDHLNGQAVSVLADGNVISGKTVSGGQITLDVAAVKVNVGLPYVSDVETLKIESPDQRGTLQGRRVTIPRITMRFVNSRGGYVGTKRPSDDGVSGLDPILQRGPSDNLNAAIPLKSDDFIFTPQGGYSKDAHMIYRQVDPLPFTLLAFIPQVVAGEN